MAKLSIVVLLLSVAMSAKAIPVSYDFTGTVTQAGQYDPVVVGQQIPIVITVDPDFPSDGTSKSPAVASYSGPIILPPYGQLYEVIVSATFNGSDNNGYTQRLIVAAGSGISISAYNPHGVSGSSLALAGALPGELPTTAIPLALDASGFTSGTFSVNTISGPGNFGFSGTINGLAVPEPASWALFLAATIGLMTVRTRRR